MEQLRQQVLGWRSLPPVRLHTINHATQNVIASTILIFERIAHALFNIDTSRSFISVAYVKLFELAAGVLEELMHVVTTVERSLVTAQVCKSCKLKIESSEFVVNLIVLEIEDFDIILCMDWSSANYIIINYRERRIIVNTPEKESIVCFEDTIMVSILIILTMEASTLLMKRWSGYLTYVMDNKKTTPTLEEMTIVKDFTGVFLEELSGL